ncbi:MAG: hypothetical protein FJ128_02525 [Deltaproteobacteria bacterium]|nr:hypothetical protein [Deltaproteobacteria bacterium]MBM4284113.1 hypothetical protein [Deltaproteobacteria bacterium]
MSQVQTFGELLDAVDNLSREDKEAFLEVLQRRFIEQRREEIAAEVEAARQAFRAGECRPASVDELVKEILT